MLSFISRASVAPEVDTLQHQSASDLLGWYATLSVKGWYEGFAIGAVSQNVRVAARKFKAAFVEPMLLLRTSVLSEGSNWLYEIKLDGYRALGIRSTDKLHLRSRNDNDFSIRYPTIAAALAKLPEETVVDGEIVALDGSGQPSFNLLQNHNSSKALLVYYIFDLLLLSGCNIMGETLERRRALLEQNILPRLGEPVRYSPELKASLKDLIEAARAQKVEGLVAKRRDSVYEPGLRSGAWQKMRLNQGQELVIGGYTPSARNFDALIIGYYQEGKLLYASRTRNGFTPALRAKLFRRLSPLEIPDCPFANLPEAKSGRWGVGLTAAKMKDCRWLNPVLVGQFEFVEWTADDHLRHTHFVALRDDKAAKDVKRES